jgi:signal transduction histidine kinase
VKLFLDRYFGPALDFRLRLFNILAVAGVLLCGWTILVSRGASLLRFGITLVAATLSLLLMRLAKRAKKPERYYLAAVLCIFYAFFPTLFFTGGGVDGSLVFVLMLGVMFTVMLLRGWKALAFTGGLIAWYCGIFITEIYHPEWFAHFKTVAERMIDMAAGFAVISAALALCVFFLLRLYDRQQTQLDAQNVLLAQASRAKSEFLSNASHEMRSPLTVISVNVQTVIGILQSLRVQAPEADELLQSAQSEVMRLARMVGGMLTLASMSEITDRQELNFSALLQSGADALRLNLQKHSNVFETQIEPCLNVFGSADLLAQVLANLLQNAGTHTENGKISLRAAMRESEIEVTVRDTGSGIAPELLPRVFERGVSDGGTGFGLYLCKTVIESHGGRIEIESELGEGTAATFTLPKYEGQYGEGAA